jgi:hypothetical protein
MPVKIVEKTVKGKRRWSVVEADTGKVKKTYSDEGDAKAYATALNLAHARKKGLKVPAAKKK